MKKNDYAKDFIVFSQENMLLYNWSKSRGNRTKRRQVLQGISNHLSDELGTKKYPVLFDREKCDQMDNTGVFVQKNKNVKFSYIALNENILLYDIIKHYILRSLQSGDNIDMRAVKVKLRPISDAFYRKIVKI